MKRRRAAGFTMIEIVVALLIMTLLAALSVTYWADMQADARQSAAVAELDAVKGDVQRWQLERRADYRLKVPPAASSGQDRIDPWFHRFRVDPDRHLIYSLGPDGQDQQGGGDDISASYDAFALTELAPPLNFRVVDRGPDWVELAWEPTRYKPGVAGYNVYRRESVSTSSFTTVPQHPEPIPDSTEPKYRDEGLEVGKVYYYALEVLARDGSRATAPSPLGFSIPLAAPPRLTVTPSRVSVPAGQAVQFTLVAEGYGSPVRQVKFDGQTFDVDAGEQTLKVSRSFTGGQGNQKLLAEAFDADGRKAQVDVLVEVK